MKRVLGVVISLALILTGVVYFQANTKPETLKLIALNVANNTLPSYQHYIDFKLPDSKLAQGFAENYTLALDENGVSVNFSPAKPSTINNQTVRVYLPVLQPYNNYIIKYQNYSYNIKYTSSSYTPVTKASQCILLEKNPSNCLNAYFHSKVLSEKGVAKSLTELNQLIESDKNLLMQCHAWAHSIGEAAGWYYKNWQDAIKYAKNSCNFGYYHGVQEGLAEIISTKQLKQDLDSICSVFVLEMIVIDCAHGLGHLAYWRTGGDLNSSMELCETIKKNEKSGFDSMISCSAGVIMNWSIDYQLELTAENKTNFVQPVLSDPFKLCAQFTNTYIQAGCYNYIHFAQTQDKEVLSKVVDQCITLKDTTTLSWCLLGYARDYGHFPSVKSKEIIDKCSLSNNTDGIWSCAQGIVYVKVITTGKPGMADEVCNYLKLLKFDPVNYTENCASIKAMEQRRVGAEGAILQLNTSRN